MSAKDTRSAATGTPPRASAAFSACPLASALTPHVVSVPRFPGPSATTTTSASSTSFAASSPVHTVTASSSPPNACPDVMKPSSSPASRSLGTSRENAPGSAAPSVMT